MSSACARGTGVGSETKSKGPSQGSDDDDVERDMRVPGVPTVHPGAQLDRQRLTASQPPGTPEGRGGLESGGKTSPQQSVVSRRMVTVCRTTVTECLDPYSGSVQVLRKDEHWKEWSSAAQQLTAAQVGDQGECDKR